MTIQSKIQLYLDEKKAIIEQFPVRELEKLVLMVFKVFEEGGVIYLIANGGNAGTMDHIYCDLKHHPFVSEDKTKPIATPKRLNVVNLCGSPAELTGLVNDLGTENMFAGAMSPYLKENDLLMAYSGSGNSPNIVRALEAAKAKKAKTFAMTKGSGGKCKAIADVCLLVPGTSKFPGQTGGNDNNFHFEDVVLFSSSIVCGLLKEKIALSL